MYYTYELIDPRDQSVFYVGKGKGSRRFDHLKQALSGKGGPKCEHIRSIVADGMEPRAEIVERFRGEQDAFDAEAALVAKHGVENLTNIMVGGFGGRQKRNRIKDAQKLVRSVAYHLRQCIEFYLSGRRAVYTLPNGERVHFTQIAYDMALDLRERAGPEFFDRIVGVKWQSV